MGAGILTGLNPEQERAVTHPGGPLLILAGAGTGKTRTITRRVAWLAEAQGVPASRILAITFTNKAAGEMKQRIQAWVPSTGMWVGTFHAVCARMLRMDPEPVGRTRDFTIYDVDDRRRTLRQLIKDEGWDPQVFRPARFEAIISGWKQRRMTPEAARDETRFHGMEEERAAVVYARYEDVLKRSDALDFDDLLWKGLMLVEHDERHARRWVDRFLHVVVDEYQDTNALQYELVKRLAAGTRNLAVCGDPDQSIYSWRGADIQNILRFDQDYPDATLVRLERNYRSVGNVLFAAQAVYALYGFGSGLLSVALLAFLFPDVPRVVALLLLVNLPTETFVVVRERTQLELRTAGALLAGIAAGIPIGAWLLEAGAGSPWLVRGLGVVIVVLALHLVWNGSAGAPPQRRRLPAPVDLLTGAVSGVLSGLFGTGGPPLIVNLQYKGLSKRAFRATLLALFFAMSFVRVPVYFWSGLADGRAVLSALVLFPACVAGLAAGQFVHVRIPERAFRRGVALLLAALGVMLWFRG